jgi:parallel beta-helix repeat protein
MAKFGIDSNMVFDADGKSVATRLSDHDTSLADIASQGLLAESYKKQGSETDDTGRLNRAIADCLSKNVALILGNKTYNISSGIVINGSVSIIGYGKQSAINSSDTVNSVIQVNNAIGCIFSGFKITSSVTARNNTQTALKLNQCNQCTVKNIFVDNTVAGIFLSQSNDCKIINNDIRNTFADGIHTTYSSKRIVIMGNTTSNTGDDGIAVVSYQGDGDYCEQINIIGNIVKNSKARGITHVGGKTVNIESNIIDGTSSSGILILKDNTYNTYEPNDTIIKGNQIKNVGSVLPRGGNQFGIEFTSDCVNLMIEGNIVRDGYSSGIVGYCNGVKIKGNHSYKNGSSGFNIGGGSSSDWKGLLCEGNTSELNGDIGFYFYKSKDGIVNGNIAKNNNVSGISSNTNFELDSFTNCNVINNHSIDDRVTPLIATNYIMYDGVNCTYSNNREDAGTLTHFFGTCTNFLIPEGITTTSDPSDTTTYAKGQRWFNSSTSKLWMFNGTTWKGVTLA